MGNCQLFFCDKADYGQKGQRASHRGIKGDQLRL